MKSHASQSNLRKKVELMYRKYRVIMIFATAITETERRKIDRNLEVLPTMTRRKILLRLPELKNILEDLTERYGFKGNFRQMENLIKQVVVREDENVLRDAIQSRPVESISIPVSTIPLSDSRNFSLKKRVGVAVASEEKTLITQALHKTNWNRRKAAQILEISYRSLLYKIKEYQIGQ